MSATVYYIICSALSVIVLLGISMMSKVKTAIMGNLISCLSVAAGIIVILGVWTIYPCLVIGFIIGIYVTVKIKMIEMPQLVALLNGIGGAASALVGILALAKIGLSSKDFNLFTSITASVALVVGMITLVGSLIAAGKLHKLLSQRSVIWKNHQLLTTVSLALNFVVIILSCFSQVNPLIIIIFGLVVSTFFGIAFAIRVGGADMPITISLLNSLSGVAGAIAGMAIGDILLVAVGGIVGASGLLLTQIMCRAMNRKLLDILTGKTTMSSKKANTAKAPAEAAESIDESADRFSPHEILKSAKKVIIVPGYGMALAQAQHQVKQLSDKLEGGGAEVKYAIHPVAGRMPGHMNVLLCEADVPYEKLYEMDAINDEFKDADAVVVIGANDVINPAARDAEGTPIYGMPVLNVDKAKNIIIMNYDLKPGYAGVDNPLYSRKDGVCLLLGNAKDTLIELLNSLNSEPKKAENKEDKNQPNDVLKNAKKVIIVPGYGMALAQAQHQVKQLSDKLEGGGAEVKYAIHPVAGRMPGHMNVLLCEADVPYEKLYEMDAINDEFKDADAVVVIGANDVINPAARDAEGTPIYGMPVLNVDKAKNIIIMNYDLKPGYAGVDNPLYSRKKGVYLLLGNAKDTLNKLNNEI